MNNFEVPAFFLGMILGALFFLIIFDSKIDAFAFKKYAECVDSVKIPVGECSKLFKGEMK